MKHSKDSLEPRIIFKKLGRIIIQDGWRLERFENFTNSGLNFNGYKIQQQLQKWYIIFMTCRLMILVIFRKNSDMYLILLIFLRYRNHIKINYVRRRQIFFFKRGIPYCGLMIIFTCKGNNRKEFMKNNISSWRKLINSYLVFPILLFTFLFSAFIFQWSLLIL